MDGQMLGAPCLDRPGTSAQTQPCMVTTFVALVAGHAQARLVNDHDLQAMRLQQLLQQGSRTALAAAGLPRQDNQRHVCILFLHFWSIVLASMFEQSGSTDSDHRVPIKNNTGCTSHT